jgi:hypothetical protein
VANKVGNPNILYSGMYMVYYHHNVYYGESLTQKGIH